MSALSLRQLYIDDKYLIMHSIGSGHFGDIRVARNIETDIYYAVKLEEAAKYLSKLHNEMSCYQKLRQFFLESKKDDKPIGFDDRWIYGFPEVYQFGTIENFNYLLMELLGYNLETLFNACGRKFSLKCTTMIGLQILSRLEFIHSCNVIFRDVKPENFVIGKEMQDRGRTIYMLDFGLALDCHENTPETLKSTTGDSKVVGTSRYMSINAHMAKEQSQRDDLESLAYVLIYFLKGSLPWQGIVTDDIYSKYKSILALKTSTQTSTLCKGLERQFQTFLEYTRLLTFGEKPDYKHLHGLLLEILTRNSEICDWKFDWDSNGTIMQTSAQIRANTCPDYSDRYSDSKFSSCWAYTCICCGPIRPKKYRGTGVM